MSQLISILKDRTKSDLWHCVRHNRLVKIMRIPVSKIINRGEVNYTGKQLTADNLLLKKKTFLISV